ncbi:MAG: TldD/PmbA family protein [Deltaproteobacteria bacterium]|nr:TldD/PmbA family protein [Deltaproteobacteria bacterium]
MDKGFDRVVEVITRLCKGRVDSYEVFLSSSQGIAVEAREKKVDALKVSRSEGAAVRTLCKGRPGFGFSNVFAEDALKDMVELTIAGSSGAAEDGYLSFPRPSGPPQIVLPLLDTVDPAFEGVSEVELAGRAISIEEAALSFDPRVKRVRKAAYGETKASARTVNSNGVDVSYDATFFSGSVVAVAEEGGDSQMGWDTGMGHKRADVDCTAIAKGAGERAVSLLGARTLKTLKCPAVFENTVVIEFIDVLSSSFLADMVLKGKSMLAGKRGKKVVSRVLNLTDDGLMRGGWASSLYDCEGVLKKKTPLIREGLCMGFLYDTYWAKREGVLSTGNAARPGWKGVPSVGTSNLSMEEGEKSLAELFSDMGSGLFIREAMGVHTVDPVSGEFSLGASGLWIEGGKPAYPVRGIAIAGTLLDLFSKVEAVGNDMRFLGSTGAPSLLFGEINASGA